MEPSYPEDWLRAAAAITSTGGKALIIGGADTGKTSFCLCLANQGVVSGLSVGVVDADVGQSHIGPPTTIGLGKVGGPIESLCETRLVAMDFVGSLSPCNHLFQMIFGVKRMVQRGIELGLNLVIINTTGLVNGRAGHFLKRHKIEMVEPHHLVVIQKAEEMELLLKPYAGRDGLTIHRLSVPKQIRRKPPNERRKFRGEAWREYFQEAVLLSIPLDDIEQNVEIPLFPGKTQRFLNLIVGLADEDGEILGLGVVMAIDPRARIVSLWSAVKEREQIKKIFWGSSRVDPRE